VCESTCGEGSSTWSAEGGHGTSDHVGPAVEVQVPHCSAIRLYATDLALRGQQREQGERFFSGQVEPWPRARPYCRKQVEFEVGGRARFRRPGLSRRSRVRTRDNSSENDEGLDPVIVRPRSKPLVVTFLDSIGTASRRAVRKHDRRCQPLAAVRTKMDQPLSAGSANVQR